MCCLSTSYPVDLLNAKRMKSLTLLDMSYEKFKDEAVTYYIGRVMSYIINID